jgi:hypothetical protein
LTLKKKKNVMASKKFLITIPMFLQ